MDLTNIVKLFNGTFQFGFFADVLSVVGAFLSAFAWLQGKANGKQIRLNSEIKVILWNELTQRELVLPIHLRRIDVSRPELLGRIGMIPRKNKSEFFVLSYLNSPSFFQELNRIQESDKEGNLVIPCSLDEMDQFDVE